MREGKTVFLHIGLQLKLRKCSLQNLSSSRTSASKTSYASQLLRHTIKRCKDLVISLQTSPMIKKLDIILPVTRARFLAEMLQQDIISTTSSRIPEIFSGGINIQLFLKSQKMPIQEMTWRGTHWHLSLLATKPDLKRSDLTSKEFPWHLKNLWPQKYHRRDKQQF